MPNWGTPYWWYSDSPPARVVSVLLSPLGLAYGLGARWDQARKKQEHVNIPVICVGNFTAGGGGKTPTCLYLAEKLKKAGYNPGFLTRGYGGSLRGPHLVDLMSDSVAETGDESRLLASQAPTVIAANRPAGARFLESTGVTHIIMDDGFQNMSLDKDLSIVVVDGEKGVGNSLVIPAGPLRVPLKDQLVRTDLMLILREGEALAGMQQLAEDNQLPVALGNIEVPDKAASCLSGREVFAFTGIALPEKFYDTLCLTGAKILETRDFPDHHAYSQKDVDALHKWAKTHPEAALVTTSKDMVKLIDLDVPEIFEVPVSLQVSDEGLLMRKLAGLSPNH